MVRQIIHIDEEKCNGCGLCAAACHEGAIDIVEGKARLVRENFCDGFGDCLPGCPMGAITFENREAPAYDEGAVKAAQKRKEMLEKVKNMAAAGKKKPVRPAGSGENGSMLKNWPVQLKLAPLESPAYGDCDLLIASDCTAYAYGNFHRDFIHGRTTLIGCPKLDAVDYSEKLGEIFRQNTIRSVHLVRMEVPCCGGMARAVKKAIEESGKELPLTITVISTAGEILE